MIGNFMILSPKLKAIIGILMVLIIATGAFILPRLSRTQALKESPGLANYYIKWDISDEEAKELAKWDLIIIAPQAVERNPDLIEIIRKNNPNKMI